MKKSLVMGLVLLGLLWSGLSHAAWNPDWKHRVKLGLNTSADGLPVTAPVDGAVVLVRLHSGNFPFVDARPDGADLRFIAADDKTPLKFHVEKFDGLNELALVWVQLPRLLPGLKTEHFWLYYGNESAAAASDAKSSFDAAQALVYHFGEREALPQDTTANANHASKSTAKVSASGLIGGGLSFDGTLQLDLPTAPSMNSAAAGWTVSTWVKPVDGADAPLAVLGEGANAVRLSVRGGKWIAQVGSLTVVSSVDVVPAAWQHVALVANGGLVLYVGGQQVAKADGTSPPITGGGVLGRGFRGEIDEFQIATTARAGDWVKLAAMSQGPDQKLLSHGTAEADAAGDAGPSYLKILLSAVTIDGWIVIAILGVMFVISVYVMVAKTLFVRATARANQRFKSQFEALMKNIAVVEPATGRATPKSFAQSSLARLFEAGAHELRSRFEVYRKIGRELELTDQSINAIRATVDARYVRESQRLNSQMVLLTICIAGGPFLGLLGTVVGVMITFAAIAAAGDVNVNAIAPGIAAALVATVAGLAVAIPALFGYNYLTSKISELGSDMEVFIDEFVTRLAENHSV